MPNNVGIHKNTRVISIPTILVEYVDKEGEKQTKLGVVVGEEVRFFSNEALSAPAQGWLTDSILKAMGVKQ